MKKAAILVTIAALLGIGGWYVLAQYKQTQQQNKNQTSKNSADLAEKIDVQPVTDPSENGQYLVIEEWGVRFKLPERSVGDIGYELQENINHESMTLKSQTVELQNCAPVSIIRSSSQDASQIKIGEHYYTFHLAAPACDQRDAQRQVRAYELQQELKEALKSLEKI